MTLIDARILLLITTTAAVLTSTHARAASCTAYSTQLLPRATTPTIPTNTRIWYVGQSMDYSLEADGALTDCEQAPRLLDDEGVEVPTTASSFTHAYVLTPESELELGATYTIEHRCLFDRVQFDGAIEEPTESFTVNAEADAQPPAMPDLTLGETITHSFENGSTRYSKGVDGEFEGILLVDIGDQNALDPKGPQGAVSLASVDTNFAIGHACVPTWPGAGPGDSTSVSFASFDVAGNFSGWTDSEPVMIEDEPGLGGCRAGGDRPSLGALGLLLGLAIVRRRRRG